MYVDNANEGKKAALNQAFLTYDGEQQTEQTAQRIAAMVLDYNMPEITGVQIAQARRTKEEQGATRIPLLWFSSEAPSIEQMKLFDAVLKKPIQVQDASNVFGRNK